MEASLKLPRICYFDIENTFSHKSLLSLLTLSSVIKFLIILHNKKLLNLDLDKRNYIFSLKACDYMN